MLTLGYAARSPTTPLAPYAFDRRALRPDDVAIEIAYCGVCHTDLHFARNDWGWTAYPCVPGHEIVGRVIDTGGAVTQYRVGDTVAVGCMVDSCRHCDQCAAGREQYCRAGRTDTYNGVDAVSGEVTLGGYSRHIVVREAFVLRVPAGLDPARTGPLLCAGITTYSPLKEFGVGPGRRVGVVGLGGLGHMAVKLAVAMGADVTVLSRGHGKADDARSLGAHRLLDSTDADAMATAASSFDLIVDTVPVKHALDAYLPLLDVDGTLAIVGQVGPLEEVSTVPLILGRRRIAGSLIGGIPQTQELLDFCATNGVLPECEMIRMDEIGDAFARMERSDVRYRFVIDMATLEDAAAR